MLNRWKDYQPDIFGCVAIVVIWAFSITLMAISVGALFPAVSEESAASLGSLLGTATMAGIYFKIRSLSLQRLFSPSFAKPAIISRAICYQVILIGVCFYILMAFVVAIKETLITGSAFNFNSQGWRVSLESLPTILLLSVVTAPLCEEIVFRGIVLRGLLDHRGPLYAIVASSILFGIIHIPSGNPFFASIIGVLLGWLYWRTRSLWPAILLHVVNNLISETSGLLPFAVPHSVAYLLLFISVLLLPVLLLRLHRQTDN